MLLVHVYRNINAVEFVLISIIIVPDFVSLVECSVELLNGVWLSYLKADALYVEITLKAAGYIHGGVCDFFLLHFLTQLIVHTRSDQI